MLCLLRGKKGFSLAEIMFASAISVVVITAILSIWLFSQKVWTVEMERTTLRVDLMQALETIKNDLRLSSLTYMSFYPDTGEPYSAVSFPVAETDVNGYFALDADGNIAWDKTVIYHLYNNGGVINLRRTVFDPRDNTMTEAGRYAQLEGVVSSGSGGVSTDTDFLENVTTFEISSLAPEVDFYRDSTTPVRVGKVVFGWAELAPGDHTIRLTISGKNAASTGYDIGLDTLMIEPSGSVRDVEYYASSYAPAGLLTLSGGTGNRIYNTAWTNSNYLEFDAGGVGSYIEIEDAYDLWRESAFTNCILDSAEKIGEEVRVGLDLPDPDETGKITWFSYTAAGDSDQAGQDSFVNPPTPTVDPTTIDPSQDIVVRTYVGHEFLNIDPSEATDEVNFIRVKFKSSRTSAIRIEKAYITRKDRTSTEAYDGLVNLTPGGNPIDQYHMHQQLFFADTADDFDNDGDTTDIVEGIIIRPEAPQNGEAWSVWTAFPMIAEDAAGNSIDYFVTFSAFNAAFTGSKYWDGTTMGTSFYLKGDHNNFLNAEGTPNWSGKAYSTEVKESDDIFVVSEIDTWRKTGYVESQIFDTTLSTPVYSQIKWSSNLPAGTGVTLKARSSADEFMTGATDWGVIGGYTTSPSSLSIGSGRYVQFQAALSCSPLWQSPSGTFTDSEYVSDQISDPLTPYAFPMSGGDPYVTTALAPWVDDVEIDWPGDTRLCTVTGYVAKKDDYGAATVTIDGTGLMKILSVRVKVTEPAAGKIIEEENFVEVQPRNTGK